MLSDLVGFIRKLPHHLVESFKSTLDEIRKRFITSYNRCFALNYIEQMETVNKTLFEIGAGDKPVLFVLIKSTCTNIKKLLWKTKPIKHPAILEKA